MGKTAIRQTLTLLRATPDARAHVAHLLHEYGPDARLCVLPQGPQTIPYLA